MPYVHLSFTVTWICTVSAAYRGLHLPSNLFKSLKNSLRFSFLDWVLVIIAFYKMVNKFQ